MKTPESQYAEGRKSFPRKGNDNRDQEIKHFSRTTNEDIGKVYGNRDTLYNIHHNQ